MVLKEQNLRKEWRTQVQWKERMEEWIQRKTWTLTTLSGDLRETVNHQNSWITQLGNPLTTAVKSFFQGLSAAWAEVISEEPVHPPTLSPRIIIL